MSAESYSAHNDDLDSGSQTGESTHSSVLLSSAEEFDKHDRETKRRRLSSQDKAPKNRVSRKSSPAPANLNVTPDVIVVNIQEHDVILGENCARTKGAEVWWKVRRRWKQKQERGGKKYGTIKNDSDLKAIKEELHNSLKFTLRNEDLPQPVFWIHKAKNCIVKRKKVASWKGREYVESSDEDIRRDFRNNARSRFEFDGSSLGKALEEAVEACRAWVEYDASKEYVAETTINILMSLKNVPWRAHFEKIGKEARLLAGQDPGKRMNHLRDAYLYEMQAKQLEKHEKRLIGFVTGLANDMVERHRELFDKKKAKFSFVAKGEDSARFEGTPNLPRIVTAQPNGANDDEATHSSSVGKDTDSSCAGKDTHSSKAGKEGERDADVIPLACGNGTDELNGPIRNISFPTKGANSRTTARLLKKNDIPEKSKLVHGVSLESVAMESGSRLPSQTEPSWVEFRTEPRNRRPENIIGSGDVNNAQSNAVGKLEPSESDTRSTADSPVPRLSSSSEHIMFVAQNSAVKVRTVAAEEMEVEDVEDAARSGGASTGRVAEGTTTADLARKIRGHDMGFTTRKNGSDDYHVAVDSLLNLRSAIEQGSGAQRADNDVNKESEVCISDGEQFANSEHDITSPHWMDQTNAYLQPSHEARRLWTELARSPPSDPVKEELRPIIQRGICNPDHVHVLPSEDGDIPPPVYLLKAESAVQAYALVPQSCPITLDHHDPGWGEVVFCCVYRRVTSGDDKNSTETFQATRDDDTEYVAVKKLNKAVVRRQLEQGGKENPYKEISLMQELGDDIHVLACVEALEDDEFLYIISHKAVGTLRDAIPWFSNSVFHADRARDLFRQILHILLYLVSNGICHRNLTPENLFFLTEDRLVAHGFSMSVRVPCNESGRRSLMKPQGMFGTCAYMAPELFCDRVFDGIGSDLWSAGVILYNMLTSQILYHYPHPSDSCFKYLVLAKGISSSGNNERLDEILKEISGNSNNDAVLRLLSQVKARTGLSSDAKDLLQYVLAVNPAERWTLGQVIESPFMRNSREVPVQRADARLDGERDTREMNAKDVYSGKGERIKRLNSHYRRLCRDHWINYKEARTHLEKRLIAESIVQQIKEAGGRYLDSDNRVMGHQEAVKKTLKTLKDMKQPLKDMKSPPVVSDVPSAPYQVSNYAAAASN